MIVAKSISRSYGSGSAQVKAIDKLSFEIESGERVAIVGRSGSGKSTLLNLISGLDTPSSGELIVNGQQPAALDSRQKAKFRLSEIGVIFQSFQLIPQKTAFQNAELPLILAGVPLSERRKTVNELFQRIGLEKRANHRPSQLSGGEQQRVAIARAVVNEPAVVLADEPTGNLDTQNAAEVIRLIREMVDSKNATLVLITHDPGIAADVADRTMTLQDGKLVAE